MARFFTSGNWTGKSELGLAYTAPKGARLAAIVTNHLGNVKGIYEWPEGAPAPENKPADECFERLAAAGPEALRRQYGEVEIIADPGTTQRGYGGYVRVS